MPTQAPIWRFAASPAVPFFLVIALAVIFAAMCAIGVLGPTMFRPLLPLSFVLMVAMPWVLMTAEGRRQIGLTWPPRGKWFILAMIFGALSAVACFALGYAMFGGSTDNWFVSIANNYRGIMDTSNFSVAKLHLFFTLPALLFSPIGEEIFFRGLLQRALEERFSVAASTLAECAAFGVVHLCHHGLLREATGLTLLPASGALWVLLMFAAAMLFAWLRKRSGSLYPAMVSHASFNLAMNVTIFSVLWQLAH